MKFKSLFEYYEKKRDGKEGFGVTVTTFHS